jgi:SAM-dependent methyltransferase
MGIGSKTAQFLMELTREKPFSGSVVTLGVQDLLFDTHSLLEIARRADYASPQLQLLASAPAARATDRQLFQTLGFSEVVRTDVDAFEGADFLLDLNCADGLPDAYRERFDCVLDGGTLEHVFHVPNALKNIFLLLKAGGRVIHFSPTNNYVDHGFYSFSPTFFVDFYTENEFIIDRCVLVAHTRNVEGEDWIAGEYSPGVLDDVEFGGLDDRLYLTFFVATKTEKSTFDRFPQQGAYKRVWSQGGYQQSQAAYEQRRRDRDATAKRPEWLQTRFDHIAQRSERLAKWLHRPSERKDFPIARARRY